MRTKLKPAVVVVALTGALLLATAPPSSAGDAPGGPPPRHGGPVTPTDEGLLGRVQSQVNRLNAYSEGTRVPCHGVDTGNEQDNTGIEFDGWLRWRTPELSQESWLDVLEADTGVAYRLECWTDEPDIGDWGAFQDVEVFPDVTGENLGLLALDTFFQRLGVPTPVLNPAGTTLVNLDTWLSVTAPGGVPFPTFVRSETISVPGVSVYAEAEIDGVDWDMGDGNVVSCAGFGVDTELRTCFYEYPRSSASQEGGRYHGTAMVVWEAVYFVNGNQAAETFSIPRSASFDIQVAEGQAVVGGDGD
jgi:hypothetical protein